MAKTKEATEATEKQTPQEAASTLLGADLTGLTLDVLERLRDKVATAIMESGTGRLGEDDVVLEYSVRLVTGKGEASHNSGAARMNRLTSERLLAEAPRRFESEFLQNVYSPVYADAMELFDKASGRALPITSIKQSIQNYSAEPLPGIGPVIEAKVQKTS